MKEITNRFLVFCVFQLLYISANAQTWFPIGASCTYTQSFYEFSYHSKPAEWKVTDTITIKGKLCQHFEMTKGAGYGSDINNFQIDIYEQSGIVYLFKPNLDTFTVLYDFNKNVGESWQIMGIRGVIIKDSVSCTLTARVTEKGIDTINGFALRTMNIRIDPFPGYLGGYDGKVIEFIGHTITPRPDPFYSCNAVSETSDFYQLRCFDHPTIGFHDYKLYPTCDYVTSIETNKLAKGISIYPNPANDHISIGGIDQGAQIYIYNSFGMQIHYLKALSGNVQIPLTNMPNGLYFVRVKYTEEDIRISSFLKN